MTRRSKGAAPRVWPRLIAVGAVAAGTLAILAPGARADAAYDAFAKATSIDATIANQSIPIGLVIEGIGPEADAHQTSYGTSDADAAFPYVGDTLPGAAGTLGGVLGLPVPAYPLIASTSLGQNPATVNYPGVDLHARSESTSTEAQATAGTQASGITTNASIVTNPDGSITSIADSNANVLSIGGIITLSGVHSHAEVTSDPSTGKITKTSTSSIGHITAPELAIAIPATTPGTIPVPIPIPGVPNIPPLNAPAIPIPFGGQTITAPDIGFTDGYFTITLPYLGSQQKFTVPAQTVLDAFKALGIDMSYQAPQDLSKGVISGAFQFTTTIPAPPDNMYFTGPTPVTFSTGDSTAMLDYTPIPNTDDTSGGAGSVGVATPDTGVTSDPGATTPATVPPASSGDGAATVDTSAAGGLLPSSTDPGASSPDTTSLAAAPDPTVAAATGPQGAQRLTASGALSQDASNIYLAFVAVAGFAFLTATALRLIGVRFLWAS